VAARILAVGIAAAHDPSGASMGRISGGRGLAGQSWQVLQSVKSLLVFPLLSTIFGIVAVVAIWVPAAIARGVFEGRDVDKHDPVFYIAA
jgi:hypothetical protein